MHEFLASDQAALQHRIHGLLVGAMQAMEEAGRIVYDFPDALPWEFTMDMARQVWDKARHVDIFLQLLAHVEGDPSIERALDFVLADGSTHVRMGSTWMRKLTEDNPARRQMALDFQHHIDELFNFGGSRQEGPADQVSISISREARKMAGFTDEEIERLVKAASASVAY